MSRWTGNGLSDGVTVNSGNRNTAGNGDSVVYQTSGTGGGLMVTAGDGFIVYGATGDIRRLDPTTAFTATKTAVYQLFYTPLQAPTTGAERFLVAMRSASNAAGFTHQTNGLLSASSATNGILASAPAITLGDRFQIDLLVAQNQSTTPTTTNGRVVMRIKNLTNTSWNTTGDWFYDSGYTVNAGTTDLTSVQVGKTATSTLSSATAPKLEQPYWAGIGTDVSSFTTRAAIEAFFAPSPYAAVAVTADFTGSGVLTAAVSEVEVVGADFTGGGTLSASAVPTVPVGAAFTGTGTLSAATVEVEQTTASFTGSGVLAAATVPRLTVSADFTGNGALAATVAEREVVAAAFTGSGALSATVQAAGGTSAVNADFAGSGTLSASVVLVFAHTAPFAGSGALTVTVVPTFARTATFTGSGVLTASVTTIQTVTANFTGSGTLVANVTPVSPAIAAFSGNGTLAAQVIALAYVAAGFSGSGVLTAVASPVNTGDGTPVATPTLTLSTVSEATITTTAGTATLSTAQPALAVTTTAGHLGVATNQPTLQLQET